jgi:subtilisin family serine protease
MRGTPRPRRRLPLAVVAATAIATLGAGFAAFQGTAVAGEGTSSAARLGEIRNAGGPTAIAGRYIVMLRNAPAMRKAGGVRSASAALTRRFGGTVEHRYTTAVQGFSARMTAAQARRLAADPRVSYVEQDHVFRINDSQDDPPSQGLDRLDQRALPLDRKYDFANTAGNVTAFIIDTGIRTTHQDFGGRASSGFDAVDGDNDATDCNGHGTHVAGTVGGSQFGVAKGVKLVAVRVLDCDGAGTNAGVIAGVDFVTKNATRPAVANMSLGGPPDPALDAAVRASIKAGVTYALAAGNENADACGSSPARVTEAITVGAIDNDDSRAVFSNTGKCVDLFAPGVDITSTFLQSDTDTATLSGTSMASPHAAGAAALFLAGNPDATPEQVRDGLVGNATDGAVRGAGRGSPNKLLFTGAAGK